MTRFAAAVALASTLVASASAQTTLYPGLEGAALRTAIRADYAPSQTLGYGPARDSLYTYEQRTDGALCGVYTAFCVQLDGAADASTDAFQKGINAEHTWPQSRGAENEPARSDLHILFPARDNVNSSRGNRPYAEIPDADTDAWYRLGDSQSAVPTVMIDEWSEKDNQYPGTAYDGRFEPREDVAGDIARAVAYFAAVYEAQVDAYGERGFLSVMLADLQAWSEQDPPDDAERDRAEWIAAKQGTGNPFVDDPALLGRAFGDYDAGGSTGEPGDTRTLWVNEIHYDNDGTDEGEFVEVAGVAGTDLSGWRLVLYNGNGGVVYDDRALSGTVDDEDMGLGAVAFAYDPNGVQNGPDAVALVDPAGVAIQFLSYEGPVVATAGPANGMTAEEIGVAEGGSTPVGQSVGLVGIGRVYADFAWAGPSAASPGTLNAGQTTTTVQSGEGDAVASALRVSVYPNPTRDRVQVVVSGSETGRYELAVHDALGRVVVRVDQDAALDLSGLPAGVYVIRATALEGAASQRLVIAR